ncbi:MAG TPA: glycoside hydrolase family 3 N-terminal domain-containing protein [Pseudonocardiaceae bacterium]
MVGDRRGWWVRGLLGMVLLGVLTSWLSGPPDDGQDVPLRYVRSSEARAALERKIGQMLVVGFRGMSVEDAGLVGEQIRGGQVGGVVLFDVDVLNGEQVRNIRSPDQVRMLINGLEQEAGGTLLVAVDQEGGRVTRLKEQYGFPPTLSQRELAQRGVKATREQAAVTARTLSQLGINVNLAPVIDLDINPASPAIGAFGRSFSADTQIVSEHAQAVIHAHHELGVLTAVKHFPGHGSATADSHRGFVDVSDTWSEVEHAPYRALIHDGMVDIVMTAHVFNRHLDPDWPATLSPSTITGLLRQRLGFDGVVMADDMQMGAIAERYSLETALQQAIVAGIDILVFANNNPRTYEPDIAPKAINIIAGLVEDGTISPARIDESVRRIEALKKRLSR